MVTGKDAFNYKTLRGLARHDWGTGSEVEPALECQQPQLQRHMPEFMEVAAPASTDQLRSDATQSASQCAIAQALCVFLATAFFVVVLTPPCSAAFFSACLRRNASEIAFRPAAESLRFFVVGF